MCGIFWYLWNKRASTEVVRGLQRLEYRGYDSAGLCVMDEKKHVKVLKSTGRVQELKNLVDTINLDKYHVGIWHTRWATHGKVTEKNCHPHVSSDKRFYVVHNGIIENHSTLRVLLENKGMKFESQTDTEVAVNMFQHVYNGDILESMKRLVHHLEWAYALVFMDREHPDMFFGAKLGSPLVIGISWHSFYLSSDYRSLSGLAEEYIALEDGDIFVIRDGEYSIHNNGIMVVRDKESIPEEEAIAELGDFQHFMLKEIFEQPKVLDNVFAWRIDFESRTLKSNALEDLIKRDFRKIHIIASGTSYHAWLLGKQYFEDFADLETEVTIATEFKYRKKFIHSDTLYVFISQSGETADVLESLKIVKAKGGATFGIVNVPGSSIARLSESGLFTHAGVEVGVASTKAFIGQISVLIFMSLYFGQARNLDYIRYSELIDELHQLKTKVSLVLSQTERIRKIAYKYSHFKNFFFLGRSYELPVAMEGSLKLKELTYLHSEAYSSGELKHGPIALIDENFPTLIVNGNGPLNAKNASSVEEIRSRAGRVIGLVANTDAHLPMYHDVITFEPSIPEFNPILETVALQIFAYCMADHLGRDVDKPRNLAKSVTVE